MLVKLLKLQGNEEVLFRLKSKCSLQIKNKMNHHIEGNGVRMFAGLVLQTQPSS